MSNTSYIYPTTGGSEIKEAVINVIEENELAVTAECSRCGYAHSGPCMDQCPKCGRTVNVGEAVMTIILAETHAGFVHFRFTHQTCPE